MTRKLGHFVLSNNVEHNEKSTIFVPTVNGFRAVDSRARGAIPPIPADNSFGQVLPPRHKNLATALGFQAVWEDVDWTLSAEIASNTRPVILSGADVRVSASSHQESLIVSRTLLNFLHIHSIQFIHTGNKIFRSLAINFAIIFNDRL